MRQRLLLAARSILVGWATLLPIAYLLERPLLIFIATNLGAAWFPTARLALDCSVLAIAGWVVGRLGRANPILAVAAFAATLTLGDFGELVEIRIPWLFQLAEDALHDPRYWDSLGYSAMIQTFLFGSLIAGAFLSRPPSKIVLSIVDGTPNKDLGGSRDG